MVFPFSTQQDLRLQNIILMHGREATPFGDGTGGVFYFYQVSLPGR